MKDASICLNTLGYWDNIYQINIKAMVCSPGGNIDFFDIVAGVSQGDTLVPYLFIVCLDYIF